jgi:hypothetical protein
VPDRPREELCAELDARYAAHMALPPELRRAINATRVLSVEELHALLANPDNYGPEDRTGTLVHGTMSGYNYFKCTCTPCRRAAVRYRAALKQRKQSA